MTPNEVCSLFDEALRVYKTYYGKLKEADDYDELTETIDCIAMEYRSTQFASDVLVAVKNELFRSKYVEVKETKLPFD